MNDELLGEVWHIMTHEDQTKYDSQTIKSRIEDGLQIFSHVQTHQTNDRQQ